MNQPESNALLSIGPRQKEIPANKVIRIEASGSYSILILDNDKKVMSSKNLSQVEVPFLEKGFFRTHKSHLINPDHILEHHISDGLIKMKDGVSVPVARRRKGELKNKIIRI